MITLEKVSLLFTALCSNFSTNQSAGLKINK
jgi:hypothetical protein